MKKISFSAHLFLGGTAALVLGLPYTRVFPTNWKPNYYIVLTLFFLALSLVFRHIQRFKQYSPAANTFFIASAALLILRTGFFNIKADPVNLVVDLALDKLSQFLHLVPVILLLTLLAKEIVKSIFISKVSLKQELIFGLVRLLTFDMAAFTPQAKSLQNFSSIASNGPYLLLFIIPVLSM